MFVCVFFHGCERGHREHFPELLLLVLVKLLPHLPLVEALDNVLLAPDVRRLQTFRHNLNLGVSKALLLQESHDYLVLQKVLKQSKNMITTLHSRI